MVELEKIRNAYYSLVRMYNSDKSVFDATKKDISEKRRIQIEGRLRKFRVELVQIKNSLDDLEPLETIVDGLRAKSDNHGPTIFERQIFEKEMLRQETLNNVLNQYR